MFAGFIGSVWVLAGWMGIVNGILVVFFFF